MISFRTDKGIITCFARKGPKPKGEDTDLHTTKRIIGNLRATVMEGSFGNQKLHYVVGRIAARNQFSETLLIFFGIHMANEVALATQELAKEDVQKKGTQPDNVLHILFIFRNGRNELLCPNIENSWPSGLP